MSNVPPPDPNSSKLGMDEWIGVIVTFTTIGAILIAIIGNREKGFALKQWNSGSNSEEKTQTKQPPTSATPAITETPSVIETPSPKATEIPETKSPSTVVPISPKLPEEKVNNTSKALPLNPVPSVATDSPAAGIAETPTPKPNVSPKKAIKFKDVDDKFWAHPYIDELVKRDAIDGFKDGTFRPNESINRAEFSALLKKAFNPKQTLEIPIFKDVKEDYWGLQVIHETAKNGFLRGYPDSTFRPTQPISRVQVLVALTSGLGLKNSQNSDQVLKTYQDADQVPKYAIEKVSAAIEAGIVVNSSKSKSLKPNQNATRAEVAALVYRALVKEGKAESIASEYSVKP